MRPSHPLCRNREALACLSLCLLTITGCQPAPETRTPPPAQSTPAAASDGPVMVTGSAPVSAIVTLHAAGADVPPMPAGPAVMDQYSRQFVPELLFVRVGQVVEFRNSEDIDHNVQVLRQPTGTTVMNESGSKGQVFTHVFEKPGVFDVVCDVHPGMRGTIVATTSPLAALADGNGRFTIDNVPQGRYVMTAMVSGRETTQDVVVKGPTTTVSVR